MKLTLLASTLALGLLTSSHTHAGDVYFFGDSLTDTGAFQGFPTANGALPTGSRWTYNNAPFYADVLAQSLGSQALANNPVNPATSKQGNNFAQGGARSTSQARIASTNVLPIVDVPDQVSYYLNSRQGRADSQAWHVVWAGGNDIPAAAETAAVSGSAAGIAQASSDANSLVAQVLRLQAAGANRFIVPTLPAFGSTPATLLSVIAAAVNSPALANLPAATRLNAVAVAQQTLSTGTTPDAASQQALQRLALANAESALGLPANTLRAQYEGSSGAQSSVNALAGLFNSTVGLGLSTAGVNMVRLDVAGLLNEILATPNAYGFNNVTGTACPPGVSSLVCFSSTPGFNAGQSYLFADDRHPSPLAQQMIGDYAVATLAAPYYAAALPAAARSASEGMYTLLDSRYRQARLSPEPVGSLSAFAHYGYLPFAAKGAGKLDGQGEQHSYTVGVEAQLGPNTRAGLALGYGRGQLDSGASSTFTFKQQRLTGFVSQQFGPVSLEVDAFAANNDYGSVRRSFALGNVSRSEQGDTDGHQAGLRLTGRYHWQTGNWTVSPLASLAYENLSVAGYSEDGSNSTAMRFGKQSQSGWQGRLGAELTTRVGQFTPFAGAQYVHQFNSRTTQLDAGIKSQPGQFTTELARPDSNWGLLRLGSHIELTPTIRATLEAQSSVGRDSGQQWGVQLGVSARF